jgi:hypothetical protein
MPECRYSVNKVVLIQSICLYIFSWCRDSFHYICISIGRKREMIACAPACSLRSPLDVSSKPTSLLSATAEFAMFKFAAVLQSPVLPRANNKRSNLLLLAPIPWQLGPVYPNRHFCSISMFRDEV